MGPILIVEGDHARILQIREKDSGETLGIAVRTFFDPAAYLPGLVQDDPLLIYSNLL
jgi:hypothetical protein